MDRYAKRQSRSSQNYEVLDFVHIISV